MNLAVFSSVIAVVQPPLAGAEKPARSKEKSASQRYIASGNFKEFQEFLLAPLAQMVSDKKLIIKTAERLGYEWNYSREWILASEANTNRFEIDAQGWVRSTEDQPLIFGFPFSTGMIETTVLDPALRAQMVVWNAQSLGSIGGGVLYRGGYLGVGVTGLSRRSNFSLLRLFDSRGEQKPEAESILFREMFSFVAPNVIRGFSVSTMRYQSGAEDSVELYSPVLKASRRVNEVNRADLLLDGVLSLDDFLMFSGNPRGFTWRLVEKKKLYVPFVSDAKLLAEERVLSDQVISDIKPAMALDAGGAVSAKCVKGPYPKSQVGEIVTSNDVPTTKGSPNSGAMVNWRFESTGSDSASRGAFAPWAPLSPVFLKRDVWVVEVFPRDPFYQYGKQVLFIDAQSYLPVYRLIYDRRGLYQKLLMAAWALASDSSARNQVPVMGFVLAVDKSNKNASIFEISEMCFNLGGKLLTKPGLFNLEKDKTNQGRESEKSKVAEDAGLSEDAGRD